MKKKCEDSISSRASFIYCSYICIYCNLSFANKQTNALAHTRSTFACVSYQWYHHLPTWQHQSDLPHLPLPLHIHHLVTILTTNARTVRLSTTNDERAGTKGAPNFFYLLLYWLTAWTCRMQDTTRRVWPFSLSCFDKFQHDLHPSWILSNSGPLCLPHCLKSKTDGFCNQTFKH